MIHSFLLIGQSNMAGRGFRGDLPEINNPRIKVLINGRWQNMFFPVNPDRPFSGRNLAERFADLYSKEHGVDVGLIPCADGGTTLDQWCRGGPLYDHAVYMAKLAQRTSTIAGVLWHQGESDCKGDGYLTYKDKLVEILNGFRADLGLYDVPFLCGELGSYLKDCTAEDYLGNYYKINAEIKKAVESCPLTGLVSAHGLTSNPDFLHFNTASLMEFGERYYEEFKKLENKNKVFEDKTSTGSAVRGDFENL